MRNRGELAFGCEGQYIPYAPNDYADKKDGKPRSLRLAREPLAELARRPSDLVETLLNGVPVHHYHAKDRYWERRVLKVDTRLTFLYLVMGAHAAKASRNQDAQVMRLQNVEAVFDALPAMSIMNAHGIEQQNLNIHTALVIQESDPRKEAVPNIDSCWHFIVPQRLHLKACLEAILAKVPRSDATKEKGGAAGKGDSKPAGGEIWRTLEGIRPISIGGMFTENAKHFDYELQLSSVEDSKAEKKEYKHRVLLNAGGPFDPKREVEQTMAAKFGALRTLDTARQLLIVSEMGVLHKWSETFKGKFKGGLYVYLTDKRTINLSRLIDKKEVDDMCTYTLPHKQMQQQQQMKVAMKSLEACAYALRQLCSLEHKFAKATFSKEITPRGGRRKVVINVDSVRGIAEGIKEPVLAVEVRGRPASRCDVVVYPNGENTGDVQYQTGDSLVLTLQNPQTEDCLGKLLLNPDRVTESFEGELPLYGAAPGTKPILKFKILDHSPIPTPMGSPRPEELDMNSPKLPTGSAAQSRASSKQAIDHQSFMNASAVLAQKLKEVVTPLGSNTPDDRDTRELADPNEVDGSFAQQAAQQAEAALSSVQQLVAHATGADQAGEGAAGGAWLSWLQRPAAVEQRPVEPHGGPAPKRKVNRSGASSAARSEAGGSDAGQAEAAGGGAAGGYGGGR